MKTRSLDSYTFLLPMNLSSRPLDARLLVWNETQIYEQHALRRSKAPTMIYWLRVPGVPQSHMPSHDDGLWGQSITLAVSVGVADDLAVASS